MTKKDMGNINKSEDDEQFFEDCFPERKELMKKLKIRHDTI